MSNYSDKAESVRVDFFKESGKWYCTEAVIWTGSYHSPGSPGSTGGQMLGDAYAKSIVDHLRGADGKVRLLDMVAVCLEPYHENGFPQMLPVKRAVARVDGTEPKYRPLAPPGDA